MTLILTAVLRRHGPRQLAGHLRTQFFGLKPDTKLDSPALQAADPAVRAHLLRRSEALRSGYGAAIKAPSLGSLLDELDASPSELQPFLYEGAAMGQALLDLVPLPGRHRWAELYASRGITWSRFLLIGRGWAYAALGRTPQWLARRDDAALMGAAAEGAGFHDTVFGSFPQPMPDWPAPQMAGYDRGAGRALWFLQAADPEAINAAVMTAEAPRRADLWNGVAFAAALVGGVSADRLRELRKLAPAGPLSEGSALAGQFMSSAPTTCSGLADRQALLAKDDGQAHIFGSN